MLEQTTVKFLSSTTSTASVLRNNKRLTLKCGHAIVDVRIIEWVKRQNIQWVFFHRLTMNNRKNIAGSHLQTAKRPSLKGTKPAKLKSSCVGRILVHCPSGNSVQGGVKHSVEPSLSPPATTSFPEIKAAPWWYRGIKSGFREVHPDSVGSSAFHGQCSTSTASKRSSLLSWPPTANRRPSAIQFTVSPSLATCNGLDSCHLQRIAYMLCLARQNTLNSNQVNWAASAASSWATIRKKLTYCHVNQRAHYLTEEPVVRTQGPAHYAADL